MFSLKRAPLAILLLLVASLLAFAEGEDMPPCPEDAPMEAAPATTTDAGDDPVVRDEPQAEEPPAATPTVEPVEPEPVAAEPVGIAPIMACVATCPVGYELTDDEAMCMPEPALPAAEPEPADAPTENAAAKEAEPVPDEVPVATDDTTAESAESEDEEFKGADGDQSGAEDAAPPPEAK